jgi:hypothetical protein
VGKAQDGVPVQWLHVGVPLQFAAAAVAFSTIAAVNVQPLVAASAQFATVFVVCAAVHVPVFGAVPHLFVLVVTAGSVPVAPLQWAAKEHVAVPWHVAGVHV